MSSKMDDFYFQTVLKLAKNLAKKQDDTVDQVSALFQFYTNSQLQGFCWVWQVSILPPSLKSVIFL